MYIFIIDHDGLKGSNLEAGAFAGLCGWTGHTMQASRSGFIFITLLGTERANSTSKYKFQLVASVRSAAVVGAARA